MSGAEQLAQLLAGCLAPDMAVRSQCEKNITEMQKQPGFGPALLEIAQSQTTDIPIRQLGAVLLKSYVKKHWDPSAEGADPYHPTPDSDREVLRTRLVSGLRDPEPRMRTAFSMTISLVARSDFPERWPSLPEELTALLNSGEEAAVHGAVRCLAVFSDDMALEQLPQFVNLGIFPLLVEFSLMPNQPIVARGCAVHVLSSTLSLLEHLDKQNKKIAMKALSPFLPAWIECFGKIISQPDDPRGSCVVKIEALRALNHLASFASKQSAPLFSQILGIIWEHFVRALPLYEEHFVNTEDPVDPIQSADGENEGFVTLVLAYINLFNSMVDSEHISPMLRGNVRQVVDMLIAYMQITDEQTELWADDINQYVQAEDEEGYGDITVRMAAVELVSNMDSVFEELLIQAVGLAAGKRVEDSDILKNNGNPRWWKYREAAYYAMGAAEDGFISHMSEVAALAAAGHTVKPVFDLISFVNNILLRDFEVTDTFLLARVLWVTGHYAAYVNPDSLPAMVGATAKALVESQSFAVRVCACKAFLAMAANLKSNDVLAPFATGVLSGCCDMLPRCEEGALDLVLSTIQQALKTNPQLVQELYEHLIPAVLTVWMRVFRDYFTIANVNELLLYITSNAGPRLTDVHNLVLPTCQEVLGNPAAHPPELLQPIVELLTAMLKPASEPTPLIQQCVGALVELVKTTKEDSILQSGAQCLAVVIRQFGAHLKEALPQFMQVLQALLGPDVSEQGLLHLGTLTVQLIRSFPDDMGPHMKDLLSAILARLHQCETPTVIQNLIIIFAQLARMDTKQVLELIASMTFGEQSGIELLFYKWTRWGTEIHGMYPRKVHLQALAQFFMLNDARLSNLQVPFQPMVDSGAKIRTRSAAKKSGEAIDQWSQCPLPVKIIEIFANALEFFNLAARKQENLSDSEDDEDDYVIGDQNAFRTNEIAALADALDFGGK